MKRILYTVRTKVRRSELFSDWLTSHERLKHFWKVQFRYRDISLWRSSEKNFATSSSNSNLPGLTNSNQPSTVLPEVVQLKQRRKSFPLYLSSWTIHQATFQRKNSTSHFPYSCGTTSFSGLIQHASVRCSKKIMDASCIDVPTRDEVAIRQAAIIW